MLIGSYTGLRAIEEKDLNQLLAWRNRPDFRRYFREHRELSTIQQRTWYEDICLNDPNTRMFSIVSLQDERLLGAAGLCHINWVDRNADISVYIGKDNIYIDETYTPDVLHIMMKYAFDELCLHRLWTEIYSTDEAKQALFPSLGFTLDGRLRETHWTEHCWVDSLFYSILRNEYKTMNKTDISKEKK